VTKVLDLGGQGPMVREVQKEYLSCAVTAKLVRGALKRAFPGVKFSVRSHVYSGGASIDVRYTDGPTKAAVEAITSQFAGGGFDGMIDMAFHYNHWLLPDGSAVIYSSPGTSGSMGVYSPIEPQPSPESGARLVSFGANYIFVERDLSTGAQEVILAGLKRVNRQLAEATLADPWSEDYADVYIPSVDPERSGRIISGSVHQLVATAAVEVGFE
jgi:hypothetical protein